MITLRHGETLLPMIGWRSHDSQPTIVSAHHYSHVGRRDFTARGDVNGTTSRVSNRPSASVQERTKREAWGPKDYPEAPVEPENPRPRSTPTNRTRAANRGGHRRSAGGAYTGPVRLDGRTWHRQRQAPPGQLLKVATDRPYPQPNRSTCFAPRPFSVRFKIRSRQARDACFAPSQANSRVPH